MRTLLCGNKPTLATLQGYSSDSAVEKIVSKGFMTPAEGNAHPELMGILPIIGAVAASLPLVGGLLDSWTGAKDREAQNKILAQQIAIESKKAEAMKTALMIGIPGVLVLAFILTRKK